MQIKKNLSKNKKITVIIAIIAVLVIGGGATALIINHVNNSKDGKTNSQEQKKSNSKESSDKNSNKDSSSNDSSNKDTNKNQSGNSGNNQSQPNSDGKEPTQYEGQGTANDPAKSTVISGGVNSKEVANNTLSISATIFQTVSEGNSTLTLTGPQGQNYTTTTDLYNSPSGATMVAFDVPLDKLGNNRTGQWKINITVSDTKFSGAITDNVNL